MFRPYSTLLKAGSETLGKTFTEVHAYVEKIDFNAMETYPLYTRARIYGADQYKCGNNMLIFKLTITVALSECLKQINLPISLCTQAPNPSYHLL